MKQTLLSAFLLFCAAGTGLARESAPRVIPALQQWTGGNGQLQLARSGRIVVPAAADTAALMPVARTLSQDLKEMTGRTFTPLFAKARKGDITLSLSRPDTLLGNEGYRMTTDNSIRISAPTAQGAFWATRTLLQIATTQDGRFPKGVATDWPEYPQRGFMLDVARKFFTMDFLHQYVKMLSFYKINEFQIHLNDNGFPAYYNNDWNLTYAAFRLQSERFPGLTAKDGSYTKAEFVDLQHMAQSYGITIIPEIDFPAHSLSFVHYKPELGSDKYGRDHLDLYKEETYLFLDSLLDEYITGPNPTFIGKDVHIGTDEYDAREAERFRWFTDRYIKFINSRGKHPRIWGSLRWLKGETPVSSENTTINAWSKDWIDPVASLKEGFKIINTCDAYLYIVPAAGYYYDFLNIEWLYNNWRVGQVNHAESVPEGTPGLMGAMFAVWNDHCGNGITEQDVHVRAFPAAQVMAEKMWRGKNENVPYADFKALCQQMPEGPGINLLARLPKEFRLPAGNDTVSINGKHVVESPVAEVGYPYAVEFSMKPDSTQAIGGILFQGPHSRFISNWDNTGKLAFEREGQTHVFHAARIPVGQWTKVRVEGNHKGTSLYINGQLAERLEGRQQRHYNAKRNNLSAMYIQQTLIFPLQTIGDKHNGFRGNLTGLKAEQGAR